MAIEGGGPYGVMGEFDSAAHLLRATRNARAQGFRSMDAYTPFPIDGLADALGFHSRAVPLLTLTGGCVGVVSGYALEFFVHVVWLPLNIGGRPLNSWPAFIPVTFEMGVLFAALFTLVGLFVLNGHPEPYHPVFNVAAFAAASRDRFFLCLQATDPRFDAAEARAFLESAGAREVVDVPA